jgi:hypothetical protein
MRNKEDKGKLDHVNVPYKKRGMQWTGENQTYTRIFAGLEKHMELWEIACGGFSHWTEMLD